MNAKAQILFEFQQSCNVPAKCAKFSSVHVYHLVFESVLTKWHAPCCAATRIVFSCLLPQTFICYGLTSTAGEVA